MRVLDLQGKKFNRLLVIERNGSRGGSAAWLCRCDCGNETTTTSHYLITGHTKSCGCLVIEKIANVNKKDHIGRRNGKLVIKEDLGSSKIIVQCDCGKLKTIDKRNFKKTESCGCIRGDGEERTKLKVVWDSMKSRCINKNHRVYSSYGGRGITICEEWLEFKNFKEWSLNNGYVEGKGLSIDRIDNNKGYTPDNCRWADMKTQIRNRSNTLYIDFEGEKITLGELSERYLFNLNTLKTRYRRGLRGKELIKEVKKYGKK